MKIVFIQEHVYANLLMGNQHNYYEDNEIFFNLNNAEYFSLNRLTVWCLDLLLSLSGNVL